MLEHCGMADIQHDFICPPAALVTRHSSPLTTASYTSKLRSVLLDLDGCRWYRLWCSEQQGTSSHRHRHINRSLLTQLTCPFARSVSPVERVSISSQMKLHIVLLRMLSIPRSSIPSAHFFHSSLVSFGPKQRAIGEFAKTQEVSNFKNTIGSLKRLI